MAAYIVIDLFPTVAAFDALIEKFLARGHIAVEDLVQIDGRTASSNDLIAQLIS